MINLKLSQHDTSNPLCGKEIRHKVIKNRKPYFEESQKDKQIEIYQVLK